MGRNHFSSKGKAFIKGGIIEMEPDDGQMLFGLFAILILLVLKGFFTACETALTELSEAKIKALDGKSGKASLFKLLSDHTKLFTTFSIHKVLSSVLITYFSVLTFHAPLTSLFTPIFNGGAFAAATVVIILLVTILMTILCDVFPKALLWGRSDEFALRLGGVLKLFVTILFPLCVIVNCFTLILGKAFGGRRLTDRGAVTEEEILMLVDVGEESGILEESQKEMINNILDFDDLEVSDIMTHRTSIIAVDNKTAVREVVYLAINSGKSRIPVYEKDIDNIIGFISVKDLLKLVGMENPEELPLKSFIREVLYIPETNRCGEVFTKLTAKRAQLAIALDEQGGTAGIVTMEDLLESIVGNIQDEYDNEAEEFSEISEGVYLIDGRAELEDTLERLHTEAPEDEDCDTIGGFIIQLLGRIPDKDESPTVFYNNIEFTVLVVTDKRVAKIKAIVNSNNEGVNKNENI